MVKYMLPWCLSFRRSDHPVSLIGEESFVGLKKDGGAGKDAVTEHESLPTQQNSKGEHIAVVRVGGLTDDELGEVHPLLDGFLTIAAGMRFFRDIEASESFLELQRALVALGIRAVVVPETVRLLAIFLDFEMKGAGRGGMQSSALNVHVISDRTGHHIQSLGDAP